MFSLIIFHFMTTTVRSSNFKLLTKFHYILHGYGFENITETGLERCLPHCLYNCLCLSFQICDGHCQLSNTSRYLSSSAFRRSDGCVSYDFGQANNQECSSGTSGGINCCLMSKPCQNGGTCHPVLPPNSMQRFRCTCPDGYHGNHCHQPSIKSCRGYRNGNRVPGNYTIIGKDDNPLKVFCDFDNKTSMTWTLVQSYELAENKAFRKNPLWKDKPYNNESPSWKKYRLSYDQMRSIQQDSTKWRMTCKYDTDGVVYTDYMSGLNDTFDMMVKGKVKQCVYVEYINVRGEDCSNCTSCLLQHENRIIGLDSYFRCPCSFKPDRNLTQICRNSENEMIGEDNFGFYQCTNPRHRCTSDQQATTQTWFGAN